MNNNNKKRRKTKNVNDDNEDEDEREEIEQEEQEIKMKNNLKDIKKEIINQNDRNQYQTTSILSTTTINNTTTTTANTRKRRQTSNANNAASASLSVDDEEEEKEIHNLASMNKYLKVSQEFHIEIPIIQLKSQVSTKWSRNQNETLKELTKSAARVMLLKGGKGDKLSIENVRSAMGDYKALVRPAIKGGQQLLKNIFGYDVILTKEPDHIYVVNTIK